MKKLLYLFISVSLILASCSDDNDDSVFDKTPDERVAERTKKYADALEASADGWKAVYYPNDELYGGFTFVLKFNAEKQTVTMYSDLIEEGSTTSTYRFQLQQEPSLIFDTFGLLHVLSDPANGKKGEGYQGEFEFFFRELSEDKIQLEGKVYGREMNLTKATAEDVESMKQNYQYSQLLSPKAGTPFFRNLVLGGDINKKVSFQYNGTTRQVSTKYLDEESIVKDNTLGIEFTANGFHFKTPLIIDGKSIQNFVYDETDAVFKVSDDGIEGQLRYENSPAFTVKGLADELLANDFYYISSYSDGLQTYVTEMKKDIASFKSIQLYMQRSWILCYSNPAYDGTNKWAGFKDCIYTKTGEDHITIDTSGIGLAFAVWFYEVFQVNDGAKGLMSFLWSTDGFYVVPATEDSYYLVSKADSRNFIIVKK